LRFETECGGEAEEVMRRWQRCLVVSSLLFVGCGGAATPELQLVEDAAERVVVRLPESLRERFAADELRMAFRAQDADETTELVTDGGYVLDKIHSVLQDYGWKAFVSLTPQHKMARKQAREAVRPEGRVLDTCMGLGYTAILASKTAKSVYTYEKDPNVVEMARYNPYSHDLFKNKNIKLFNEDISEAVKAMKNGSVDVIIHDPPTLSVAGALYSNEFYADLHRVLRAGGRLLHYTGAPKKHRGVDIASSISRRLNRALIRSTARASSTGWASP